MDPPRLDELSLEDLSPFEKLHHELVWKIVAWAPDVVFNLREVSRRLKACADEFIMLKPPFDRLVRELRIQGSSERKQEDNPSSRIYLTIYVPRPRTREFALRLFCASTYDLQIKKEKCKGMHVFRINCYANLDCEKWLEFLTPCLGKRIEKVHLSKASDLRTMMVVSKLLHGIKIEKMRISFASFTDDIVDVLMRNIDVRKLTLEVKHVVSGDSPQILIDLSSLVRFLHVQQQIVETIDSHRNFFFGAIDVDWAPIIIQMFTSGKMDKLAIDNFSFPEYLSLAGAEMLRERLPALGKKIWFEATCEQYDETVKYTQGEYSIKIDGSEVLDRFLMVKHSTRI